jgi:sodium/bile acid cotransporter 7
MVKCAKAWGPYKILFVTHFLPIAFLCATVWALAWPAPGKAVGSILVSIEDTSDLYGSSMPRDLPAGCIHNLDIPISCVLPVALLQILDNVHVVQVVNTIIVFFISGLVLKTQDLKTALHHKLGVAFGFVSILLLTPCLGFAIRYLPLTPYAFTAGLTILTTVPTTLGVGIALVRSCKGNEGLALLLTVGSNLLGVVTIPLWLKALFANSAFNLNVDILSLFVRLVVTVFVPSVLGKVTICVYVRLYGLRLRYKGGHLQEGLELTSS